MVRPILAILACLPATVPAFAQKPEKSDNERLPGATWVFEATKGELVRKGEFRIFDSKVFLIDRNIGTVQTSGDEVTLIVRGNPVLNGRVVLKRDRREASTWRGVINHGDGSTWQMVVQTKAEQPKKEKKPPKEKKKP